MSLRFRLVAFALTMATLAATGCTVQTGSDARDASWLDPPRRTHAVPRRKAQPPKVTPKSSPPADDAPNRTPAVPVRR